MVADGHGVSVGPHRNQDHVPGHEGQHRKCEDPVVLETPAGTVKAKRRACVQVEDLGENVEPLALRIRQMFCPLGVVA